MKKKLGKKSNNVHSTIESYSACGVCNACGCRTCTDLLGPSGIYSLNGTVNAYNSAQN